MFPCNAPGVNKSRALRFVTRTVIKPTFRVPRVHRFFSNECGCGYIMMNHAERRMIDQLGPDQLNGLVCVLDYFSTLKGKTPGSLTGAPCRRLLWSEAGSLTFADVKEMETWFNSILFPGQGKISFQSSDLVPCRLHLAPRNILWQSNGSFCLVDWVSTGFFPGLFKFWAQWIIGWKDGSFNQLLLRFHEREQQWSMCRVRYHIQKYLL